MLYMRDIAMGGFPDLAFAAVLAAVSSGVMQTGNVYDQADEYRMLALEGTDEATLDKARMMEVITPLNTVMAVSLGVLIVAVSDSGNVVAQSGFVAYVGRGNRLVLCVDGARRGVPRIMRRTGSVMPRLPYGRLMASPRRSWIPRRGLARSAEEHRDDCDENR